ncbi:MULTISPECIES: hypothetical protein [Anaerolinea]|nr:hypothetical protein [Anaerolinea thermophila]
MHCEALMEADYDPPFHNCAICDECSETYHNDPPDENDLEEFEA